MKRLLLHYLCLACLAVSCKKQDCGDRHSAIVYPYTKIYDGHFSYWHTNNYVAGRAISDTVSGELDTTASVTFFSPDSCVLTWIVGTIGGKPNAFTGISGGPFNAHYTPTGFKQHSPMGHLAWEAQFRSDSLVQITTDTANGIDSWFRSYQTFSGKAL